MQAVKRRRLSAAAWAAMVEKFEASGQSEKVFCQQERLSLARLQRWRAAPGEKSQPRRARVAVNTEAAPFVDLGRLPIQSGQLEVRLDFGGGVVLQLSRS